MVCQEKMSEQLALKGTAEAAFTKLALKTLWFSAGRSNEPAYLTWDALEWEYDFEALASGSVQMKVAKVKSFMVVSGKNRHMDWFLDLADHLILQQLPLQWSDDSPNWMLPSLQVSLLNHTYVVSSHTYASYGKHIC